MDLSNPDGRGSLKITRMTIVKTLPLLISREESKAMDHHFLRMNTFIMRKTGLEVNLSAKHALSSKTAH